MRLRTILVVLVLVLAGCSGFGGSTDGTPTNDTAPTATLTGTTVDNGSGTTDGTTPGETTGTSTGETTGTSTETSDGTTTETGSETTQGGLYPPGVDESGLQNLTALLAAQRTALNGSAHVTDYWLNATLGQDSQTTHTLERVDGEGGMNYLGNRTSVNGTTGASTTQAVYIYGNDSVGFSKEVTRSPERNRTVYTRAISGQHVRSRLGGNFFALYVALGNYTTTNVEGSGESARITLEATEQNETFTEQLNSNITSYQGTLVVDGEGVIRSADIAMTADTSDGSTDYTVDFDRTSVGGDVTITEPSWYDTALESTVDVGLEASAVDGTAIEVTNTGSDPIASGRAISLSLDGAVTGGYVQLEQSIEPGETVYLYKTDANGRFQVSSTPPSDAVALTGTYGIELRTSSRLVAAESTATFD